MRDEVWLCGASGRISFEKSNEWREFCKKWFEDNSKTFRGVNPNDYYNYREQLHDSDAEIMEFCRQRVERAKVILINLDNSGESGGTLMEIAWANMLRKPVIGFYKGDEADINKVTYPWILATCNKIKTGDDAMLDALYYIEKYYGEGGNV